MKKYSTVPVLYSIMYSFKGWQNNKNHAFPSHWARLCCWISPCYGPFSLGARFETYEPIISLIFQFFFGPRQTEDNWNRGYGGPTVQGKQIFIQAPSGIRTHDSRAPAARTQFGQCAPLYGIYVYIEGKCRAVPLWERKPLHIGQ
jgi:hypothetical protein